MPPKLYDHIFKSNVIQLNLNVSIRICSDLPKPEAGWGDVGGRKPVPLRMSEDIKSHPGL